MENLSNAIEVIKTTPGKYNKRNPLDGVNSRMEMTEARKTSELEDKT